MLLAGSCLSSCATESCNLSAVYPVGGTEVAKELETLPYQGYEHFWEWLARINKLRQELSSF